MPAWLQYALALLAVAILWPAAALLAKRHGQRVRGGVGLAMILLGLGEVVDPPSKHLIEAKEDEPRGPPAPGDPPKPLS